LLAAILNVHPALRGVLADQPHVIERAKQRGFLGGELAARASYPDSIHFVEVSHLGASLRRCPEIPRNLLRQLQLCA